jgi:hypothetical protein
VSHDLDALVLQVPCHHRNDGHYAGTDGAQRPQPLEAGVPLAKELDSQQHPAAGDIINSQHQNAAHKT